MKSEHALQYNRQNIFYSHTLERIPLFVIYQYTVQYIPESIGYVDRICTSHFRGVAGYVETILASCRVSELNGRNQRNCTFMNSASGLGFDVA